MNRLLALVGAGGGSGSSSAVNDDEPVPVVRMSAALRAEQRDEAAALAAAEARIAVRDKSAKRLERSAQSAAADAKRGRKRAAKASQESVKPDSPAQVVTLDESRTVDLPLQQVVEAPAQNLTMEGHSHRYDAQLDLFRHNMAAEPDVPGEILLNDPPSLTMPRLGGARLNEGASSMPTVFEYVPVYGREHLQDFLRVPRSTERPCLNMDRDRVPGESEELERCAGHERSAQLLGPERAFRLREMVFGDNGQLGSPLPDIPEMCIMCHMRLTYRRYLAQLNDARRRTRRDLTAAAMQPVDETRVRIINRWRVIVDVEGEYRRNACIPFESVDAGLCGGFVRWHPDNYTYTMRHGTLPGFAESDRLVFRLARASPARNAIKKSGATGSSRSAPNAASQAL